MLRLRRQMLRQESGYAMVLLALSITALMAVAGLTVDVGSWYLRSSQIQRAADAASLAGAAKMPDLTAAIASAKGVAEKNGFVNGVGGVKVTYNPRQPHQFDTKIVDPNVPVYFAKIFTDKITIQRQARGEFVDTVPLGSPFSVLGTGNLAVGGGVPLQNYWLAVNGYCTPKEDGDLFSSAYDGSKPPAGEICPGLEVNKDYLPEGYDYMVEVPPGAGAIDVKVYDPAFAPSKIGPLGMSPDASSTSDNSSTINTKYTLWDTLGTTLTDDDTLVGTDNFTTNDPRPGAIGAWWHLGTVVNTHAAPYKWRVQVQSEAKQMNSYGVNSFGLAVDRATMPNVACDSRLLSTCPRVYGKAAISVFANLNPGGSATAHKVDFYLAEVNKTYAGRPLHVSLWDPGEGGKSIQLLAPDGTVMPFTYTVTPSIMGGGGKTSSLDVSGLGGSPGPWRGSPYKYNDRLLQLTVQVPVNYKKYIPADGSMWWRIQYKVPATGLPADRSTWSAVVEAGDPVHLIRAGTS